ncbi:MAG: TetR family transcriptional regulator [Agrococcus casei]|uniref:Predicted biotin repressor from TetR family n=1 Tax=Agrococcus casei LMG 22410 TaxID=1255656 RepID=A0A1R4G1Y7_9MICO|nr:TetR family transcriptional regulator [Agrococcus casei]SJM62199.1 Predicted biotin repressor from TetR family [Agrococcus casei LMG 22410]
MHIEQVVDAAIAQLDRLGLPDLSMRQVAAALEVQPSALYWHVASKQHLLGLVADRILADCPQRVSVVGQVDSLRLALLARRDGAELVASSIALGMGGHGLRDRLRRAAGEVPETQREAVVEACALLLLGSTQLEQQRSQAAAIGVELGDEQPTVSLAELARLMLVGSRRL